MAIEKKYFSIDPVAFTGDGQESGLITVESTACFKVNMDVLISSDTQPESIYSIKRVVNETQMFIGPEKSNIKKRSDMTAFLASENASVRANEQDRPNIPPADYERAVYEEEPTVAKRVIPVNKWGEPNSPENPLFTQLSDGDINIGTVNGELEVQLSRQDNDPDSGDIHDSVRLGNQDYELTYTANDDESKAAADVIALNRLIDIPHDDIEITQFTADGDPEIIEFRENTNLKLTLTLTYNADGELQRVQRSRP